MNTKEENKIKEKYFSPSTQHFLSKAKSKCSEEKSKLKKAAYLVLCFMIIEFIGGLFANSIAIMSDAAHLFSDVIGFCISIIAISISEIPATESMSFGFHRAEIIGALTSIILIWGLTIWLLFEAIMRILHPPEINSLIMMITAIIGLIFNLIIAKCLHHHSHGSHNHEHSKNEKKTHTHEQKEGKEEIFNHNKENSQNKKKKPYKLHTSKSDYEDYTNEEPLLNYQNKKEKKKKIENINVRAAMIHVIGDIIQSIGVLLAAIIIWYFPFLTIADPICTFIFSIIVGFTTVPIVSDSISVLMEGTPMDIDFLSIKKDIEDIEGVSSVHDLHIWALCPRRKALTVHIIADNHAQVMEIARKICFEKYKISHSTIQVENLVNTQKCINHMH